MQCKCTSDKQLKKFIHSAELWLGGRKINTNLMRGSKTNSTVVLSTQNTQRRGEERRGQIKTKERGIGGMLERMEQVKKTKKEKS